MVYRFRPSVCLVVCVWSALICSSCFWLYVVCLCFSGSPCPSVCLSCDLCLCCFGVGLGVVCVRGLHSCLNLNFSTLASPQSPYSKGFCQNSERNVKLISPNHKLRGYDNDNSRHMTVSNTTERAFPNTYSHPKMPRDYASVYPHSL